MRQECRARDAVAAVLLPVAIALTLLPGCGRAPDPGVAAAGNRVRGIVLITVDGLSAGQLSIWDGPLKLEGLERLASAGSAWRGVWTPCPMTRPAVASYLTGVAPDRHGVVDDVFEALPEGLPTLAAVLGQAGFRTAAFPDSSFLGPASGLLRDFEVWDVPPRPHLAGGRWIPEVRPASVQLEAFRAWTASLGPEERYFGWVHLTRPLLAQLDGRDGGPPPALFDDFASVLDGVLQASAAPDVAVAVLGTLADVTGGSDGLAGIGYSLDERAVAVPLVVRFPGGHAGIRGADAPVWGLDVSATLARLGGVALPGGEGIDLFEPRTPDDPMFALSWATLDQLGWKPQRAARLGSVRRTEGLEPGTVDLGGSGAAIPPELDRRLEQALAGRSEPERTLVPFSAVEPLLRQHGLRPDPRPSTGREFGDHARRVAVSRAMWSSRQHMLRNESKEVFQDLRDAASLDPDNLCALLDRGQMVLVGGDPERAAPLLRRAVELYPGNPECLHWFAHSLWADHWQDGAKILEATLPYVSSDRDVLYDLACAASLTEDLDGAESYLRRSIDAGYDEWESMEVDPDLRHLRESGRFARLMQEYRR